MWHVARGTKHVAEGYMAMPPTKTMHKIVSFCQFTVTAPSDCVSQCETLGANNQDREQKGGGRQSKRAGVDYSHAACDRTKQISLC